jgi:succinate dehydrogenase / fumarate reductase flavoprotein subunit
MDLEFTQFHPTGMVWPLSVRGILVTEGVRGDGGILLNKTKRFMFELRAGEVRGRNRRHGGRSDALARRRQERAPPPELLTRDVGRRSIRAEVKAGRGSPHGGAFLDIASRRPPTSSSGACPACTTSSRSSPRSTSPKEPMEVGPTLHYFMGGIRVDADTQMTRVPGPVRLRRMRRRHARREPPRRQLALGSDRVRRLAGKGAADYVRRYGHAARDDEQIKVAIRGATDILNRESGENPYLSTTSSRT